MWDVLDRADLDPRTDGDAGQNCTATWRYVPARSPEAGARLTRQLRYIQHDSAALFTAESSTAHRCAVEAATARTLIWENRGRSACFHRYILSPSRGLGLTTAEEMQDWTRQVMTAYGEHLGRELVYVGAVHRETRHPHVHILIAGKGRILETPERAAQRRRTHPDAPTHKDVVIKEPDHATVRGIAVRVARGITAAGRATRRAERWAALDERLGIHERVG